MERKKEEKIISIPKTNKVREIIAGLIAQRKPKPALAQFRRVTKPTKNPTSVTIKPKIIPFSNLK